MNIPKKIKSANIRLYPQKLWYDPEWIVLGVNNVCNLHCKMCDVGTQNLESNFAQNLVGTHPIHMPLELIKKVIDQQAQYFPNSKLAYAFTEPLVYRHLIESLEYANQKGLFTTMTTNALTLKHKAEKLVKAGLNEIYISLDGPQDIHNEIRGHKSSFQKALEGIEQLKSFPNAPKILIICAITEWNVGHLKAFTDSFKDINIEEIAFMHTQFADPQMAVLHNQMWGSKYPATDSNLDEIDLKNMNLPSLLEEINAIQREDYPFNIYFSPNLTNIESLTKYYHKPQEFIGKRCGAVFSSIMIKSDGSVIPAHGRCYNLTIGNLYEQPLKEIWNSQVIQRFRKDLLKAGGLFPGSSRCCSAF